MALLQLPHSALPDLWLKQTSPITLRTTPQPPRSAILAPGTPDPPKFDSAECTCWLMGTDLDVEMAQGPGREWSLPSEEDAEPSDSGTPCGPSSPERASSRAARQKQAQQRYRARRKTRMAEMEVEVAELSKQDRMVGREGAALARRHADLQARVVQLEAALTQKEAEAASLRSKLPAHAAAVLRVSGNTALMREIAPPGNALRPRKAFEQQHDDAQLRGCVAGLASLLDEHDLRADPLDGAGGMAPESQQRLRSLLAAYNVLSAKQRHNKAGGSVTPHPDGCKDDAGTKAETERWTAMAGTLALSPAQRQSLLDIRRRQLLRLAELDDMRKDLCMQTMAIMLPTLRIGLASVSTMLETPESAAEAGAATAALCEHVDAIKEVLRQQQQALTESDDDMMQRILGPAQCALLIVDALPAAAVALPLAETVASMYGDPEGPLIKVEATPTGCGWQGPTSGKEASFGACAAVQPVSSSRVTRRSKRPRLARGFGHDGDFCFAALPAAA